MYCLYFFTEKTESQNAGIEDQRVWSMKECASVLKMSLQSLKDSLKGQEDGILVWDKV